MLSSSPCAAQHCCLSALYADCVYVPPKLLVSLSSVCPFGNHKFASMSMCLFLFCK